MRAGGQGRGLCYLSAQCCRDGGGRDNERGRRRQQRNEVCRDINGKDVLLSPVPSLTTGFQASVFISTRSIVNMPREVPQRQCPDRKTFVRLHYRLCEYGKFNSPGLGRGRPGSTTPEVQEEILEAVNMTPSISTRRVALQVNVPHTYDCLETVEEYQLYPYHLQRVQALSPADIPCTS
ncbi:hypothetical protein ANN_17264 [Periplaneta americana]|uniref:Uncharacterized protein n=1 Tax=Periplaneta americana TaxID=6978 RepID=A0ABQ8SSF7_PERAM|nr:hypothetical protein ANN_17264 [Periplaneta americana]